MSPNNLLQNLPSLASIIDRDPLTVYPDLPIVDVIAMMSQGRGNRCLLPDSNRPNGAEISLAVSDSAALVLATDNSAARSLVGIFTERDLVKLTATQTDLRGMRVADVMTRQLHTLVLSAEETVVSALSLLQHYRIRHLPILDAQANLLGIVTPDLIRQILQPTDLLKFRSLDEGMTTDVIHATADANILQIAQLMVEHHVSSIVIVAEGQPLRPVGIITEKDIVQFQVLELDLTQILAQAVMSTPLFCLQPEDSLWSAQKIMESKQIRRLVVTGVNGELRGIVTQSNLLKSLDPLEMLRVVDSLQAQLIDRATELELTNQELKSEVARRQQVEAELRRASQRLEERMVERTAESALLTEELQIKIAEQQSCDLSLEISQQGISDFIEHAPIGMDWVDLEGITVWANQAELDMLGYDRSEYIGQPLSNFHVEPATMADILQRLLSNQSISNREAQMRRKDGSICDVSIDANAFFRGDKFIHARCFIRDISEQKQAETIAQERLTSLQFQEYALDRAAIVATTDRQGKIIYVNDKFCEISQYSAAELLGKTHLVINSDYHPPEFFRDLWAVITSGQVWSGEIKNRAKDGSYYWVATTIVPFLDDRGQPFQYLSIRFDITQVKREAAARQQIEAALRNSEQRFRAIFDGTFQFIGLLDPHGILLEANRTALNAIGATPDDVVGQAFWATPWWTHSPDLQLQLQQAIIQAATGELVRFEAKHFLADGSHIIVDFSLSPIFDRTGKVVMLIPEGRDISDRKQIETALQASEARWRALLTAVPVGIFQADVAGNCLFVNQQCLELMGATLAEVLGQGWANSLHPDDREWVYVAWHSALQSQQEFSAEYRFMTPHGQVNWVASKAIAIYDEAGTITGYLGTAMNITDRKAGEQKIREQAALIDVATDAIIVRDLESQIQFWNNGAEWIYGWTAAEAIGQKTTQLLHLDLSPAAAIALNTVQAKGAWQGELRKLTKTGKEVVIESRWTLIRDETGNPESILSVDTDVTENRLLERQFLRAQRLESLGTLASGIAHDLNNVLTPILGAAQLLPLTLTNLADRDRRLLTMLVESSQRGSNLVKQILTFAKGMDGERTAIQIRHLFAEILSVVHQTFPKSIETSLDLPTEDLWMICVDATQIHQVLMNLFVNARDAMPRGGTITATVRNLVLDDHYAKLHLNICAGSYLVITIADTGMGIDQDQIDRIFEPFFTTKATGTGLGLSTVLGIIRAHGGFINVYSEIDRGTCFKVYLPAITTDQEEQLSRTSELFDGNGQLVLVVDDEAAVREIAKDSLEAYNYRVMLASNGVEAIALYDQNQDRIAIVLLDMMMPNLDTPSVIQALRRINPDVKIVVMSGLATNDRIVEQYELRAFLTKPFTMTEMLHTLAAMGD